MDDDDGYNFSDSDSDDESCTPYGCLRSPDSDHPIFLEDLVHSPEGFYAAKIPDEYDLRTSDMQPRYQGQRGTCAAFTGATIKEHHEIKDMLFKEYMSPEFLYYHRQNKPLQGMHAADMFRVLKKVGSVPETIYPYGSTIEPTRAMYTIAKKYTIDQYARIRTIAGVKQAILQFGPCYLALPKYKTRPMFWRVSSDVIDQVYGHAVAIIGWTREGFIIKNSWGPKWNGDGYVIFPYIDWPLIWECWLCVDRATSPKLNIGDSAVPVFIRPRSPIRRFVDWLRLKCTRRHAGSSDDISVDEIDEIIEQSEKTSMDGTRISSFV